MDRSVSIASPDPVLAPSLGADTANATDAAPIDLAALHARATAVAGDPVAALPLARELADALPLPGSGATERRWSALATLGAADLTVARAIEPHLDAVAILAEAEAQGAVDRAALPAGSWGVFAAEARDARLAAHRAVAPDARTRADLAGRVLLTGTKPWCSLAGTLDAALVTAWDGDERALYAVSLRGPGVRVGGDGAARWVSRGLRAVESLPVRFVGARAVPVGGPGWYLRRPGFAWGGIGVAAIWFGAAVALARRLRPEPGSAPADDLALLHLGEAERVLRPARAMLAESARLIDERAHADGGDTDANQQLAWTVRAAVARAVDEVAARVVRATGPGPLAFDEEHARRVADLGVYVRQEHGERDAFALGASLAGADDGSNGNSDGNGNTDTGAGGSDGGRRARPDRGPGVTPPEFSHLDAGTDESVWAAAWHGRDEEPGRPGWRELDAPALFDGTELLVAVAAHPDDETLGAGGLIAAAAGLGIETVVVALTAGEGSHPKSPTHTPEALQRIRRRELDHAIGALHPGATVHHVGLPDGDVAAHLDAATAAIVDAVARRDMPTLIVAPWRGDGHPDHDAAGTAAAAAAARTDARLLEYPVWLWHWGGPGDVPWPSTIRVPLTPEARERKRLAIATHVSQVAPLSPAPGDEAVVGPAMLARAGREHEVFFALPPADDAHERLHRAHRDPWSVDSSDYEAGKRAATLETLPRPRYRLAIDAGCSIGRLTLDLADRCDRLVALDASATAVEAARRRTAHLPHVEVRRADVPGDWPIEFAAAPPGERCDLVVVSELGYYLSPAALERLLDLACDALAPGGELVLCHWRHAIEGWPLDAAAVHAAADAHPRLERIRARAETDYLLGVYRRSSS